MPRNASYVVNVEVLLDLDLRDVCGFLDLFKLVVSRCGCFCNCLLLRFLCTLGFGVGKQLSLCFLLGLNEQALVAGFLSLDRFLFILFLFALGCGLFLAVSLFLVILGILKPGDEFSDEWAHGTLSSQVMQGAILVELQLFGVPLREEFVFKHAVVIQLLAEGLRKLLLLGVPINEELDDCLKQVFFAVFFVLTH